MFALPAVPLSATLDSWFDDDGQVFLNGTLVIDDASGNAGNHLPPVDVLSYLQPGLNLIAASGHDYGGNKLFASTLSITLSSVPEIDPSHTGSALALMAAALGLIGRRRRNPA